MHQFSVENTFGKPTLSMDGSPIPPVLYGLSDFPAAASNTAYAFRNIRAFGDAGIRLVNIDAELQTGWHKTTAFEPDAVLAEVANVLDANPDAKVLIRLHVNAPYWWLRDHPEECAVYRTPDGDLPGIDDGGHDRLIAHDGEGHMRASLASELWLREAGEKLRLLCDAFAHEPEGDVLMGIQIACGNYGEWHPWYFWEDVSAPTVKRFRRMLQEKYGTDAALAKAWNQPGVTIESAEYHPERFLPGDDGDFRDPRCSQHLIDARECAQTIPADAILHFCRIVKEHLPHILAGTFYGYYLGTSGDHLQPERLFAAKGIVDFLCGPFCYLQNRNPECVPMQRGLLESSRLRGMLWLTEMDQHPEGGPEALPQTIAVLRRNVLQPLLSGQGLWYYDHRVIPKYQTNDPGGKLAGSIYRKRGWWEAPELMAEIEKLQRIARRLTSRLFRPEADVLIVYGKKTYYNRTRRNVFDYRVHDAIMRAGAVCDCIYLDELEVCDLARYRCVLFHNCFVLTPEERARCRALTEGVQRIWFYAQGYCDGETLDTAHISDTVGLPICRTDAVHTITLHTPWEETFPVEWNFSPMFAAEACEGVTALGHFDTGGIAAAACGQDLWLALPMPTPSFLREVFRNSGVHLWSEDGDPILAGGGIVAINAPAGGRRTIRLKNGRTIHLDIDGPATLAFDAESGEALLL